MRGIVPSVATYSAAAHLTSAAMDVAATAIRRVTPRVDTNACAAKVALTARWCRWRFFSLLLALLGHHPIDGDRTHGRDRSQCRSEKMTPRRTLRDASSQSVQPTVVHRRLLVGSQSQFPPPVKHRLLRHRIGAAPDPFHGSQAFVPRQLFGVLPVTRLVPVMLTEPKLKSPPPSEARLSRIVLSFRVNSP